jgi:hypothetical protein
MRKIRISKRYRPANRRLEPLPLDPRDREIMRAKQLAARSRRDRGSPGPEDHHG